MNKKYQLIIHPIAEKEFLDSVTWYEKNRTGLGERFLIEVEKIFDQIENNPFLYPTKKQNLREAVVKVFPYIIVYSVIP